MDTIYNLLPHWTADTETKPAVEEFSDMDLKNIGPTRRWTSVSIQEIWHHRPGETEGEGAVIKTDGRAPIC